MLSGQINVMNVVYIYATDKYVRFKLQQKCRKLSLKIPITSVKMKYQILLKYHLGTDREPKISQNFFWLDESHTILFSFLTI